MKKKSAQNRLKITPIARDIKSVPNLVSDRFFDFSQKKVPDTIPVFNPVQPHIAALLMTFFYIEMPQIIEKGFLYLAQPPLFRIKLGDKTEYAIDEMDRDKKIKTIFNNSKKVEVNRFKGLGEMPSKQLKETTMSKQNRRLIQVKIPNRDIHGADERTSVDNLVTTLMGKKAELRFDYIRKNAPKASITLDI